jgi:hypothetical protein
MGEVVRQFIARLLSSIIRQRKSGTPHYDAYKQELEKVINYMDEAYFNEGLDLISIHKFNRDLTKRQLAIERLLFIAYTAGEITREHYMYIADSLDKVDIKRAACVAGVLAG